MATVASLTYIIDAQTASFEKSMQSSNQLLGDTDRNMRNTGGGADTLSTAFDKLGMVALDALKKIGSGAADPIDTIKGLASSVSGELSGAFQSLLGSAGGLEGVLKSAFTNPTEAVSSLAGV